MTYPEQEEIVLTTRQVRLLMRLLAILTEDQVEQFIAAAEEVVTMGGHGCATVKFYRGHARFVERTFTEDLLRG